MARPPPARDAQTAKTILLAGGLDRTTPADSLKPGRMIAGLNYEGAPRGYKSSDGFERLDGRPKPSEATYGILAFDAGVGAITAGQTVQGLTSGATGIAVVNAVVESGTYGGNNAAGFLVLYNISGTFQNNETLRVGGVNKSTADGVLIDRGASNDADDMLWLRAVIDFRRAAIQKPTGSGPILGVTMFEGIAYCFRNNVGNTAAIMHKATATGWQAVDLGRTIAFTSGGATEIVRGNTITGATSGATAVVREVIVTSGTWAAGTAAGRMTLSGQVGTFVAENLNVGASLNLATVGADSTAITLAPNGKFRSRRHNFYGASNLKRLYFCDGVNRAHEFDGFAATPIITGMAADAPQFIEEHYNHLFLGFRGGSLQHSGPGTPHVWSVVLGAAELGIGENLTGLISAVSGVLMVMGQTKIAVLYGKNIDSWDLVTISPDAGGFEDTLQNTNTDPFYLDNRGLRRMGATQNYGNFAFGAVSDLFQPVLDVKRSNNVYAVGSMRVRGKAAYRVFFSDGTGVSVYLARSNSQGAILPEGYNFDLGFAPACLHSYEDQNGEVLLAGTADGWVYQLDAGTSFDGVEMGGYCRLSYYNIGSPMLNKAWKKATIMLDADANTLLGCVAEFDYGNEYTAPGVEQYFDVVGGGGNFDEANWNEIQWSASINGKAEAYIDGLGPSCSLTIFYRGIYQAPHTLQSVTYNYVNRGLVR